MESKLPMIVAITGPSSKEKSEIACKLAEFLRYPLIDEEDIILNLLNFLPNSSNELPFRIVGQISKTQLKLKLQVIINTPLLYASQFDDLVELANSKEASLIIVECTSESHQGHEYDVGNVPKLIIDTTKPFVVDEFVPAIIRVAEESHKKVDKVKVDKKITPQRCFTEAHAHEFCVKEEPEMDSNKLCCKCENSISGSTYQCIVCEDFSLHESCAKSQQKMGLAIAKQSLFYRESNPSTYEFPEEYKCRLCEHYSDECNDCLLQSHIKWGILPAIHSYEDHPHPLSFVIVPFWFNYEYKCIACEKYGKFVSYKCYSCYLDLHPFCAFKSLRCKALGPSGPSFHDPRWDEEKAEQWDDGVFSTVRQLKLSAGSLINSIQIEYDQNGRSIWSDVHGQFFSTNENHEIKLDYPEEYLTSIEGSYLTTSSYTRSGRKDHGSLVTSLTFTSNKRKYGPYPSSGCIKDGDHFFSSPVTGNKVVGFHGASSTDYGVLLSIGIYVEPIQQ